MSTAEQRSGRTTAPTIDDVAATAGVSRSTVSRALGGYGQVSERARTKILDAAQQLGYRVNLVARSTRTGRAEALGLVVADVGSRFFSAVTRGFSDVAHASGYQVVIANTDDDADEERLAIQMLQQGRVDGFAVAPAQKGSTERLLDSHSAHIPMVTIDRRIPDQTVDSILLNSAAAAREAVGRLVAAGHRDIGIVTGLSASLDPVEDGHVASPGSERIAGYAAALRAAGTPLDARNVLRVGHDLAEIAARVAALLGRATPPSAIFATDERHALGVLQGVRLAGMTVPADVSLVAIDDPEWASVVSPALSVVAQPSHDVGALAAERLIARLSGDEIEPKEFVMDFEWIPRESIAAPPRR